MYSTVAITSLTPKIILRAESKIRPNQAGMDERCDFNQAAQRQHCAFTSWVFSQHGNNFVKTIASQVGRERDTLYRDL